MLITALIIGVKNYFVPKSWSSLTTGNNLFKKLFDLMHTWDSSVSAVELFAKMLRVTERKKNKLSHVWANPCPNPDHTPIFSQIGPVVPEKSLIN